MVGLPQKKKDDNPLNKTHTRENQREEGKK